ncbi:MAG: hypothetical protein JWN66_224 [Sphingomonas bacterium]|nr:hypothetical protein [Sphingomonas bacterium]
MPVSLLALLLMAGTPVPAEASPGKPALLQPVIEAAARCSTAPQLVVAMTGFTPPKGGHATLVVSLRTADGRRHELGQVGIFPEQAFTAKLADAQRFGFALPKGALARNPRVMVEIRSDGGTGARATIAEARIGPAPQERC